MITTNASPRLKPITPADFTVEKFITCKQIFSEMAYNNDGPLSCEIISLFKGVNGLDHNCIECNIAESIGLVSHFLESAEERGNVHRDFTMYFLLIYLLVERIEVVFSIIQLAQIYKDKHFKVFNQIRKWANFIKHPKAFVLAHHPKYNFENSGIKGWYEFEQEFAVTINEQFVERYYKGAKDPEEQKKLNKELFKKLQNRKDVLVVFPDIEKLTRNLCYAIQKFVDIITKNEVYKDILQDEATISNYFENQYEDVQIGLFA